MLRLFTPLTGRDIIRRIAEFVLPLLLVGISINAVVGCGSGTLAFDGGHIPPGGGTAASIVSGVAYAAESYTTPVVGATVTVTNMDTIGAQSTQTTVTAADGSFKFNNGFPDVPTLNRFQVSVSPPPGSSRLAQQLTIPVTGGQSATVLVAMPPSSFDESLVTSVTILKQSYSVHTGGTIAVGAELLDNLGAPLGVSPSLIFTGGFGVIKPGGLFTSTTSGTGTVQAYWYTGTALLHSNLASVTASPLITVQPPPPPPPITVPASTGSN